MKNFSLKRLMAMIYKEFIAIRRDKVTIGMIVTIPLLQLVLFGYAINVNPRNLPTVVISQDHTPFTREFVSALQNTKYFNITNDNADEKTADYLLRTGKAQFVVQIPPNFTRKLIHGDHPKILITADATDPASTSHALAAINQLPNTVFARQFKRGLQYLEPTSPPFQLVVHMKYNPELITQYNIVPGLMGVILTMTLVMMTCLGITKEREFGTMEHLLATPVRPLEVMIGKILPYIIVGYIQQLIILLAAQYMFGVPNVGSSWVLMIATLPFIAANLTMGLTFSTLAENQLQAVQMTFFFFLPSMLLSGFMFPFYGMPQWAQWIGEMMPLTHFLRIIRGIMLKDNGFGILWTDIWPMLVFVVLSGLICLKRYRQTLD